MTLMLRSHSHVHFVGIGGIGMSALARYLRARGYEVSGSDRTWNEQMDALQELGVVLSEGHDAANIGDATLIVVTSAAAETNPEVGAARARGIEIVKRAVLLGAIGNEGRCVAVAGTHGKTTTSGLIGHILTEAGLDPTILIGGVSINLGSNARVGESEWIVVEADEYDRSFLQLRPAIAVITSSEADHLDIYGTEGEVRNAYHEFALGVRETVVVCADDPFASDLTAGIGAEVVSYGVNSGAWRADDLQFTADMTQFSVRHNGHPVSRLSMSLAGVHNVQNALAAFVVALRCGVDAQRASDALSRFQGVRRRFEVKGNAESVLVMDDYAHHPTEIKTNLAALKARYDRPIRVVFQPHTYSRTRSFLNDFAQSFSDADAVYLMDVYAARETDTLGVSGEILARETARHHPAVTYRGSETEVLDALESDVKPRDVVITMGAGDVTELGPKLLQRLSLR